MKHVPFLLLLATCVNAFAGAPQAFTYQAIARDSTGNVLQITHLGFRFTIHDGSQTGSIVYQETDTVTTDRFGLVAIAIDSGIVVQGSFSSINWTTGNKYLQVELDPSGGTNYINMGTSQLLSVPYSLHAHKSDTSVYASYSDSAIYASKSDTAIYSNLSISSLTALKSDSAVFASKSDTAFYSQIAANAGNWNDYAVYDESEILGDSSSSILVTGSWTPRFLNHTEAQSGSSISLSNNDTSILLQPGTYHITATAPFSSASGGSMSALRIRRTSPGQGSTLLVGQVIQTASNNSGLANIDGVITIVSASSISLQQFIFIAADKDIGGPVLGVVGFGENSIFARILIEKVQ